MHSYLQDLIRVVLGCRHKKFMSADDSFCQKVLQDHARVAIISVLLCRRSTRQEQQLKCQDKKQSNWRCQNSNVNASKGRIQRCGHTSTSGTLEPPVCHWDWVTSWHSLSLWHLTLASCNLLKGLKSGYLKVRCRREDDLTVWAVVMSTVLSLGPQTEIMSTSTYHIPKQQQRWEGDTCRKHSPDPSLQGAAAGRTCDRKRQK